MFRLQSVDEISFRTKQKSPRCYLFVVAISRTLRFCATSWSQIDEVRLQESRYSKPPLWHIVSGRQGFGKPHGSPQHRRCCWLLVFAGDLTNHSAYQSVLQLIGLVRPELGWVNQLHCGSAIRARFIANAIERLHKIDSTAQQISFSVLFTDRADRLEWRRTCSYSRENGRMSHERCHKTQHRERTRETSHVRNFLPRLL